MEQKLHTPEGVRDIYSKECEIKLALQKKLSTVLHLYGYQDIQTPTFEYYDVFRKEIGSISTRELYKFFDRDGNILALRPDITPSVARAAATLFEGEDMPIRLCYAGNTFINHNAYLMDGAPIKIGSYCFIGPNCGMYTAAHPLLAEERNQGLEKAKPITIGNNVWIGADVTILPGVTIGDNTVIGAKSVITKDIPSNVIAVGNPCRVLREITEQDSIKEEMKRGEKNIE